MKRRALLAGLATGAAAAFVPACGPSEILDRRRELLASWGHAFLLSDYAAFEDLALELETASAELAATPNASNLEAAQNAWWAALAPWKRTEVFAFGPYTENRELGRRIEFWPSRPDSIEEVLEADAPLDGSDLDTLGAPAKGLSALEYLLFDPNVELVDAFESTPRRGEYTLAVATDLVLRAQEIRRAWDPEHENFLAELVDAGRTSTRFASLNSALGEIVNRIGYTLENARIEKLGRALGDKADGTPQPHLLESPWGRRSLEDIADNLRGIELLYAGDAESGLLGLDSYLTYRGRALSGTFRKLHAACRAAIDAVPVPLEQAVSEAVPSVRTLMAELAALQRFFQLDVLSALSLAVGFNDNDGD